MLQMNYRPRIYYTETDKALMWDRWEKGDSLHSIARLFDRSHGSIAGISDACPNYGDYVGNSPAPLCTILH
jgi:hypothetical protein